MEIPVLFVDKKTNYANFCTDLYDKNRNALSIVNTCAALYHPPCRTWGRLRHFTNFYPGEHWLAVWSVIRIRKFGGVLEHPAGSSLWKFMCLPLPGSGCDNFGGFSIKINQSDFGFKCEKNTWLYIVGCSLKDIPAQELNFNSITHTISSSKKNTGKKELTKSKRAQTTNKLAAYLLQIVEIINYKKLSNIIKSD